MPRPRKSILTDGETRIMRIIWEKGKSHADEIRETLRSQGIRRSDSAIRCTLRILEKKGVITHTVKNRTFIYTPKLTRLQAERDVIQHIINLFYPDSPGSFAWRVLDETELTPEVIQKMREKLREVES